MSIFDPDSWKKSGEAIQEAGRNFKSSASGRISGLQNTGADGGISILDGLIAGILPAVRDAVEGTLDGIKQGLQDEGAAAIATGDAYKAVEDAAEKIGNFMEGEYY
ncbi:MAG: hypothetical protein E7L00_04310 [Propionibacteriaceae bacterium]|nr:hypothetical protein [Propionibacteriaceae bacterium]